MDSERKCVDLFFRALGGIRPESQVDPQFGGDGNIFEEMKFYKDAEDGISPPKVQGADSWITSQNAQDLSVSGSLGE